MKKAIIFILASLLLSCESIVTSLRNPCDTDSARDELKKQVGIYMWAQENTMDVLLGSMLAFFGGDATEIEEKAMEYVQNTSIREIGKPEKGEKGVYKCSAIVELRGKRYGALYTLQRVHSGKEEYYRLKLQEVLEVR